MQPVRTRRCFLPAARTGAAARPGGLRRREETTMGFAELFLIAVGLSMDAFAVSVCKGLCMKRLNMRQALVIALFFGGFQGLMPLLGWALGTQFERYITPVDHWIAFGLLALIGGKMLWDAFHEDDEELSCPADGKLDLRELVMLAIATSIDALAVGITFAFLRVDIVMSRGAHQRHHVRARSRGRGRGPPLRRALREGRHHRRRHRPRAASARRSCWSTWASWRSNALSPPGSCRAPSPRAASGAGSSGPSARAGCSRPP